MKTDFFKEELEMIKNAKLKDFAIHCLENVPEYFWNIPASSTSKYHPQYSLGEQGLLRHVKTAIQWYVQLCRPYNIEPSDTAIIALLLHDCFKCGKPEEMQSLNTFDFLETSSKTVKNHPELVQEFILNNKDFLSKEYSEQINEISEYVVTHMGIWGNQQPQSTQAKLVALSDYCSSRKIHEQF